MGRGRAGELARNAALVSASIAAALLLLDAVARFAFFQEIDTRSLRERVEATRIGAFTEPSADPLLLYQLKRGARVVDRKGVRIEVDPSGCCRVVPGRPLDAGTGLRIALVGDSSPFGWGVPFEQSYGEQLRSRLEATLRRRVSLRNFSVPGYNSLQNRLTVEQKALPWKPRLLILHYDHNDSDVVVDKQPDYMDPAYGENPLHSALVKLLWRGLRRRQSLRSTTGAPGGDKFFLSYRYAGPQFERHMAEMRRLREAAARADVPVIAFLFNPWLRRFEDERKDPFFVLLHEPVARRLRGFGYLVVDCYPAFQRLMKRTDSQDLRALWLSTRPLDGHPNARGHRLIAELLAQAVLGSGALRPASRPYLPAAPAPASVGVATAAMRSMTPSDAR